MTTQFYMMFAYFAGLVLPLQIGLNSIIAKQTGSPVWAAAMSFLVGSVGLFAYYLSARQTWPAWQAISAIPLYAWGAGLLGAFYVTTTIVVAPKIGAAMLISLTIGGQMTAAIVLDHYGLLGFPQHSISGLRIIGALLVVAGVVLIRKF
jgi:transporter family-2 protein